MICRPSPYLVDKPRLIAAPKKRACRPPVEQEIVSKFQNRTTYPGDNEKPIADVYIPAVVGHATTKKTQQKENSAEDRCQRGAYEKTRAPIVTRMLHKVFILLLSELVSFVGHDEGLDCVVRCVGDCKIWDVREREPKEAAAQVQVSFESHIRVTLIQAS